MIKIHIKSDESSHEYIIPDSIVGEFDELSEQIGDTDGDTEKWYDLIEEFKDKFGKYREYAYNTELWITEEELERITK